MLQNHQENASVGVDLLKKKTLTQVFSYEFCEIFKSSFLIENLWVAASAHIYFIKYRSNRRRYKEGIC